MSISNACDMPVPRNYLVIGGGIAGVCCAEELCRLVEEEDEVTLITSSDVVKAVTNWKQIGKVMETFDVREKPLHTWIPKSSKLNVVRAKVSSINTSEHSVSTEDGQTFYYNKLCICSGGKPNIVKSKNPYVVGIRDTSTVDYFSSLLSTAERVVILGNGGIALELVYEIAGCEVIWVIKDETIGNRFLDEGAAAFFLKHLNPNLPDNAAHKPQPAPAKKQRYVAEQANTKYDQEAQVKDSGCAQKDEAYGSALGPNWSSDLTLRGSSIKKVHVEYKTNLKDILNADDLPMSDIKNKSEKDVDETAKQWPVYVVLDNGKMYGCDLIVSATGVTPNIEPFESEPGLHIAEDGGLVVDSNMRTTLPDVYAAGDVCTPSWCTHSPYWHQMRLWNQARQMGTFSARCMVAHLVDKEDIPLDFCFDLFSHVTTFFGYKVILLGKYNCQGLGDDYELLVRCTDGQEYIKVVLHNGKMYGAMLIGETDLEETFENLILNQLDLSSFGETLLDPDIDIEDYFD